ncbi:hypothetical protein [Cellulomonas sp. HZM]|uniref:hypothetical protein n=1 Tax=Cellulomonas sp. HZM TaxID=1454010 RepID=UPI0012DC873B|nr:hypothetical protein [Cellulomonas sp. HZM]
MPIDYAAVWGHIAAGDGHDLPTPPADYSAASSSPTVSSAVIVALCALAFTILSFWWINVRRGRLTWTTVVVFSGHVRADRASLRIPITLYNTGAKPLVVVDLRLDMTSGSARAVAPSKQYRRSIMPSSDDMEDFPHPYVVPGRSVVTKFVDFAADPLVMSTGLPVLATLLVLRDGKGWRRVRTQEIRTDSIADPSRYITYSNDPAHWPPGQLDRAAKALLAVRSGIRP